MKARRSTAGILATCTLLGFLVTPVYARDDALTQLEDAETIYRQQGPEVALPRFEQLNSDFISAGNRKAQGRATRYLGEIYWRLGDFSQARFNLEDALDIQQQTGDRLQEGKTLNVLGLVSWDRGEFKQAQENFSQASNIAEEMGDQRLYGATINNLGLVSDELGDYYASLELYKRALEIYASVDFRRGEGDTLGNIGGVYLLLGQYHDALKYYKRALDISLKLNSPISMSQDYGNVALSYMGLGQFGLALEHLEKAETLATDTGMKQDQAYWLGVMGNVHLLRGRYDKALELHGAGLEIYDRMDGKTEMVGALHDMGQLYLLLGDSSSADVYFRRSMELAQNIGLSRGLTINQVALGDLQYRQSEYEAALDKYGQASERARESGEMGLWVEILLRQSGVRRVMQMQENALETATQALKISRETGALGLELAANYAIAEAHFMGGDLQSALERYAMTTEGLARAPNAELAWRTHYGMGLTLAEAGRSIEAIESLRAAIVVIENVREHIQQDRFRAGYIQDKYQVYVDMVRLQLEAGKTEDAFSTAERLRSRAYMSMLESTLPESPITADRQTEYALKERIRTLRQALVEEQGLSGSEQRKAAISVYSRELVDAEKAYQAYLDDRRHAGNTRSDAILGYADVRDSLSPGEALVEYVVGKENVVLFLLTHEALLSRTVKLRRDDLDNKVELVRNLISRQDNDRWKKPAASLSRLLLAPLFADGHMDGIKRIYLVPHGTLNYLPFALLPGKDGQQIIQDYILAYLPTAVALINAKGASDNESDMLAMAPARSQLQYASAEASAVNALFDPNSMALVGEVATETAFKQQAGNYRYVHLATHGYFNRFSPMLSGLELETDQANDGQLELHEILGMNLDADLVTLSACQTGLGSGYFHDVPAGDDLVGLTRAFLHAGSSSVLATLWDVNDASTLDLMDVFYRGLNNGGGGTDKAAALARAQRSLLASERYGHPYFWAPFVLVGQMKVNQRAKR